VGGVVPQNGNNPGVLSSLAGMPGARAKRQESVQFSVNSIEEAMATIRRLQGTGALTINFHSGKPNGQAEWKTSMLDKSRQNP
jgi:isopentenyl diphosphate isomerase/L-lactate dehydrogenase-like FMN-dependent dehydrogenase